MGPSYLRFLTRAHLARQSGQAGPPSCFIYAAAHDTLVYLELSPSSTDQLPRHTD